MEKRYGRYDKNDMIWKNIPYLGRLEQGQNKGRTRVES